MSLVDSNEVIKIIKDLKSSSAGWDEIDASIFKSSLQSIIIPFTHICNLSLRDGVFPNEMKVAKVCLVFKGSNLIFFVQYRPVSVLPVMSKVLERIMYDKIYTFLQSMDLLYAFQFGFRKTYSTYLALMLSFNRIINALENGDFY